MKLTIWDGIKLGAWLITAFLIGLMLVVYFIDKNDSTMDIMFYFNKIFILIIMWPLLYLGKFLFLRINSLDKNKLK